MQKTVTTRIKWLWRDTTHIPYHNCYGLVIGDCFFGYTKLRNYIIAFGNQPQSIQFSKYENPRSWTDA